MPNQRREVRLSERQWTLGLVRPSEVRDAFQHLIDMSSISTADVVIVGAGPAGSAAAIASARAGLRTILLDGIDKPDLQPGETIHPGAECLFEQLGILDEVSR